MSQIPLGSYIAKLFGATKLVPLVADSTNTLLTTQGGGSSLLNITTQTLVKGSAGRIGKVIVNAPGSTSGAFQIYDSATVGGAAASNLVWELAYNGTANVEGAVFNLDFPCLNGIVINVPGGSPIASVSFS